MKIKTQFLTTLFLFGLVLLLAALSLIITKQQIDQLDQQAHVATSLEQTVGELGYLSNEYVLYRENPQRQRWESKFVSFSNDLARLNPTRPQQQVVVNDLKANRDRLRRVFDNMASVADNPNRPLDDAAQLALIRVSWSRLQVQYQALAFRVQSFVHSLRAEVDQLDGTNNLLILTLIGVLSAYFIANYLLIYRRTLASLSKLQAGISIIGSGNLDFVLAETAKDEIGALARAFNRMTVNLKAVTISNADLERVVAERTADLRQREDLLRAASTYARNLIETSLDPLVTISPDGKIMDVNRATEIATGLTRNTLIDDDFAKYFTEPDRARAGYQLVMTAGHVRDYPLTIRHITGKMTDVLYNATVYRNEAGQVQGIFAAARDITERKRAEEALAQERLLLRMVIDNLPDAVYAKDRQGRKILTNHADLDNIGRPESEVLYKTDSEVFPPPVAAAFEADDQQVLQDGQPVLNREELLVNEHGRQIWQLTSKLPLKNAAGQIVGLVGIGHNITERKQRERELEAIAAFATALRAASTRAEMISAIVRQTFDLLQADGVSLATHDPATGEAVIEFGQDRRQNWTGRRFPARVGILGRVITSGRPYLTNDVRHDPTMLPLEPKEYLRAVACVPLLVQAEVIGALWVGKLTSITDGELRVLVALSDIAANGLQRASVIETLEQRVTDRTHELTAANEKLQELDRLKDQFVSSVSHELRTPLTSIILQGELLEHGKPEKRQIYLNTLRRETNRLRKMIEDLLDLSRIDRDVTPVRPIPTDLNGLLDQLLADRRALADQHGLTLTFQPAPDLLPALLDPIRLTQVVSNLLTNAINYTPAGGTVAVMTNRQVDETQAWITCTVQDTGPGISAADQPHLFERFYRGEVGRHTNAPGTGLGLSISKEIVERLGGRLTVESEPGHGAAFTVWLKPATQPGESAAG